MGQSNGFVELNDLSPVEQRIDAQLTELEERADAAFARPPLTERTDPAYVPIAVQCTGVGIPKDSAGRKRTPLCTGLLDYFGGALDLIAYAPLDEFPDDRRSPDDLADMIVDALSDRDRDGAPSIPRYRQLCLAALSLLHQTLTGGPAPIPTHGTGGLLREYSIALSEVAKVSYYGNEKHNPGQPLHHAREKSTDHADCILRHLLDNAADPGGFDGEMLHAACLVWRCLALTQIMLEASGSPKARGAR